MRKLIAIGAVIVVLAIVGTWSFAGNRPTETSPSNNSTQDQTPETVPPPANDTGGFTADDVALHDNASDCWMIIDGQIYDVTDFIRRHPGGSEILRGCGRDATSLFMERRTEDGQPIGSGTPHSGVAHQELSRYRIDTLTQ